MFYVLILKFFLKTLTVSKIVTHYAHVEKKAIHSSLPRNSHINDVHLKSEWRGSFDPKFLI